MRPSPDNSNTGCREPPAQGINWANILELAFALSLVALGASLLCAGGALDPRTARPWIVDLLLAIDVNSDMSKTTCRRYFSPNTHLSGEALLSWPAARCPSWLGALSGRAVARGMLLHDMIAQIMLTAGTRSSPPTITAIPPTSTFSPR